MINYIKAELLKIKRTSTIKIVIGIPFVVILIGVIPALFGAREYLYYNILNWWYVLFFPTVLVLITGNIFGQNDKKNGYKGLLLSVEDTEKIGISKLFTVGILSLISIAIYLFLIFLLMVIYNNIFDFEMTIPFSNIIVGALIIDITYLFLIPIVGILVKKFSYLVVTIISIIVFNILDAMVWQTKFALYNPFSIPSMLMSTILKILPNGLLNNGEIPILNIFEMTISIGINMIIFMVFSIILVKIWRRKVLTND